MNADLRRDVTRSVAHRGAEHADAIRRLAGDIGRAVRIMEVCGTHTVSLRRHGIHSILPDTIRLVSGPGCPVCVTPTGYVDNALLLAEEHGCRIVSFGDMLKVPSSDGRSLSCLTASGAVQIVYSPAQAVEAAAAGAGTTVVFLGIGFETTIPVVVSAALRAREQNLRNLFLYTAFKTVPPALKALLGSCDHGLDGLLLPGHVSAIIGEQAYSFLSEPFGVPGVIAGFEPCDMLAAIEALLVSIRDGERRVQNAYSRVVRPTGNRKALELMGRTLTPCDAEWRGLGVIPAGGLAPAGDLAAMDAAVRFDLPPVGRADPPGCRCAEVIQGRAIPTECGLFGAACTPDEPVGPCMVSSEGTCAAYLRYGG